MYYSINFRNGKILAFEESTLQIIALFSLLFQIEFSVPKWYLKFSLNLISGIWSEFYRFRSTKWISTYSKNSLVFFLLPIHFISLFQLIGEVIQELQLLFFFNTDTFSQEKKTLVKNSNCHIPRASLSWNGWYNLVKGHWKAMERAHKGHMKHWKVIVTSRSTAWWFADAREVDLSVFRWNRVSRIQWEDRKRSI